METTIVVLFAVVVLAMLALIWLLRLFFKNYQHRSEGAAFRGSKPEPPKIPSADQRGLSRARSMG